MRRTTLILAVTLICACGAANSANGQPAPATASPVALTCTASGAASPLWPAVPSASATAPAIASAAADGDTLKLTFASGTPQFEVVPVGTAHFIVDPSGRPVDLAGASGVKIVLRGFRGHVIRADPGRNGRDRRLRGRRQLRRRCEPAGLRKRDRELVHAHLSLHCFRQLGRAWRS